jgi:methyl-accepting chemotaxis protein
MNSLFLRMRLTHWVGIVLLLANAFIFTDNFISQIVQIVIAVVIFIHDLDEKINGVDVAKKVIATLSDFKAGDTIDLKLRYSKEYAQMVQLINDFTAKVAEAKRLAATSQELDNELHDLREGIKELEDDFASSKKTRRRCIKKT